MLPHTLTYPTAPALCVMLSPRSSTPPLCCTISCPDVQKGNDEDMFRQFWRDLSGLVQDASLGIGAQVSTYSCALGMRRLVPNCIAHLFLFAASDRQKRCHNLMHPQLVVPIPDSMSPKGSPSCAMHTSYTITCVP